MTEESRVLRELAGRVLAPYLSLPGVQAATVTGSVAEGESDRYSDADMTVYYADTPPTNAAARKHAGMARRKRGD